ncbi:MAG: hypothetical protein HXX09_10435 [Bacteroidetes bacterium]|nr:hypothetical protein [Bacteroidota bacterium]
MKKYLFALIVLALFSIKAYSQLPQNVSINSTGNLPDPSSMLDVSSTDKGLLIPRMTTAQRTAIASPAKGLLVFDNDLSEFWYYNGAFWTAFAGGATGPAGPTGPTGPTGGGTGTCTTLDGAYNCGGAGAGRIITANSGAFEVNASTAATNAIKALHSNSGVAVNASSTLASNAYSTIQSTTASTNTLVSAVLGNSSAAGYGVSGQIAATGTAQAGVYGNNLRTTGGHGVWGFGYNGVVGETNYVPAFGLYGYNHGAADPGVGTAGIGITGIAGQSTNLALSYGVYSYDDGGIVGALDVGGNFSAGGTKAFRIQHPTKPDMFLKHFCLESPEVLNVYRGNAILDANGEAIITLPEYFSSININFSYNLTSIGTSAPELHIKDEVKGNAFSVAGGKPNSKISWTVYAERNDKYIQEHPDSKQTEVLQTERDKKLLKGDKMPLLNGINSNPNQPIIKVLSE